MKKTESIAIIELGSTMPDNEKRSIYYDNMLLQKANDERKFKALLFLKGSISKFFKKYNLIVVNRELFLSIVQIASQKIDLTNDFSKHIFAESFGLLVEILDHSYELKVRNITYDRKQLENHLLNTIPLLRPNYNKYIAAQKSQEPVFNFNGMRGNS